MKKTDHFARRQRTLGRLAFNIEYPPGHTAPSTAGHNPDPAQWDFAASQGHTDASYDVTWVPKTFYVRCRVEADVLPPQPTQVQNWNEAWAHLPIPKAVPLYDMTSTADHDSLQPPLRIWSLYQSVRLVLSGEGQADVGGADAHAMIPLTHRSFGQFQLDVDRQGTLYRKTFLYQTRDQIHQRVTWDDETEKSWRVTPPGERGVIPLYGFAGYVNPTLSVGHIQQAFFQIDFDHAPTTQIRLSLAKTWAQQGVAYPQGGLLGPQKIVFMDQELQKPSLKGLTLADDIYEGVITVTIKLTESCETFQFRSHRFDDRGPGEIDIHFLPVT